MRDREGDVITSIRPGFKQQPYAFQIVQVSDAEEYGVVALIGLAVGVSALGQ